MMKKSAQAGNVFFMLFAAVAVVGGIGAATSNHMKGLVASMSDVTRKTIAEEKMTSGARLAVQASTAAVDEGDCDGDGMVEPMAYRDAGTLPKPTGGGLLPLDLGATVSDPWGTAYGYCVWDPGTVTVSNNIAACGGAAARRLNGSPNPAHVAVAIISAGKDRKFSTTCNAYVDTTPADGNPDTPMVARAANGDDVIMEYTYTDANGLSGEDLWKVRDTKPDTATIDKNIEVSGSAQFGGALNLMEKGLVLPSDPGDDSVTGACGAATDQQLRVNIGTSPPSLEICYANTWEPISMGAGAGGGYSTPTETQKLVASDPAVNKSFGVTVSIMDDTAIIGAWGDTAGGSQAGAAYVFTRSGGTWTQQQKLVASDPAANKRFGGSVSISGNTVIIGAPSDNAGGSQAGAAYVFTRSGSTWTQQQKLVASDPVANKFFGERVSINGDTVVIGAYGDNAGGSFAGAAYVFTRSGVTWTQQQKLVASDPAANKTFGTSVIIAGDMAIIGARGDNAGGSNAGAAYVFARSSGTWTQQQKLVASDPAANKSFGASISVFNNMAVIGAYGDSSNAGAAYIFARSSGTWTQQQKLVASDSAINKYFGGSVSISGDTVAIGANNDSAGGSSAGATYVFTRTGGTWTQQQKLVASDPAASKYFGGSVSIAGDIAIIGAQGDAAGGSNAGAAYVFEGMCFGGDCSSSEGVGAAPPGGSFLKPTGFLGCTSSGRGPFALVGQSGAVATDTIMGDGTYLYSGGSGGISGLTITDGIPTIAALNHGGTARRVVWTDGTNIFSSGPSGNALYAYSFDGTTFTNIDSDPGITGGSIIAGNTQYIFTAQDSAGLAAYKYDGSITKIAEMDMTSLSGNLQMWADDRFIYLRDQTSSKLSIISFINGVLAPVTEASIPGIRGSFGDGRYVYAYGNAGLKAFTFDGVTLTEVGSDGMTNARAGWSDGVRNFIGYSDGTIRAVYFNGTSFVDDGSYNAGASITSLWGDGTYIYAATSGNLILSLSGYGCSEPASLNPAVVIAANQYRGKITVTTQHSACGIKSDNTAWCWGDDAAGALGNGSTITTSQTSPYLVDSSATPNAYTMIVGGYQNYCGLRTNGTVWCWGLDSIGALGNGAGGNTDVPGLVTGGHLFTSISVGNDAACGIREDARALCWGRNGSGQGGNGLTSHQQDPILVTDVGPWVQISASGGHTCGIKSDGSAWCWGDAATGALGTGLTTPTTNTAALAVAEPGPWVQISAGAASATCGIKLDGSAWCWGDNTYGQLGIGQNVASVSIPTRVADPGPWIDIAQPRARHTCGIKIDGSAWCWGDDTQGQLGNGSTITATQYAPSRVADPGPWATIVTGAGGSAGLTCGIKIDGSAWCWGYETNTGHLGNGAVLNTNQHVPSRVVDFPSPPLFSWNDAHNGLVRNTAATSTILPPNALIGFDESAGGLTIEGARTVLRSSPGNIGFAVNSVAANTGAQVTFKNTVQGRSIGVDHTSYNLEFGTNTAGTSLMSAITPDMVITPSGDWGIGLNTATAGAKLDITNGGIRVGNDTGPCAPSRQGTLRWNGTIFQYCNGAAWTNF